MGGYGKDRAAGPAARFGRLHRDAFPTGRRPFAASRSGFRNGVHPNKDPASPPSFAPHLVVPSATVCRPSETPADASATATSSSPPSQAGP
jgi:hypothetical protein